MKEAWARKSDPSVVFPSQTKPATFHPSRNVYAGLPLIPLISNGSKGSPVRTEPRDRASSGATRIFRSSTAVATPPKKNAPNRPRVRVPLPGPLPPGTRKPLQSDDSARPHSRNRKSPHGEKVFFLRLGAVPLKNG